MHRRDAANENRTWGRGTLRDRPDRIALWAVGLALLVLVAAAVSASAQETGGISPGEGETVDGGTAGDCRPNARFGSRILRRGDCGNDVRTLNWILKSKRFAVPALRLVGQYGGPTERTVRRFQRRQGLAETGALNHVTRTRLVRTMWRHRATWYGPGFWGNRTACGQRLRKRTRGVAHRRLPCGTRVVVRHRGRTVRTRVIDRGPFANRARWDLTRRVARQLNFSGGDVRVARVR